MRHNITGSEAFEDRRFLGPGPGLVQQRRTQRLIRQKTTANRRPLTFALMGGGLAAVAALISYGLQHISL